MVAITLLLFELSSLYPPPHAPTPSNGAARTEKFFQITPAFGCDWVKIQFKYSFRQS
jgi:hypothetical protein